MAQKGIILIPANTNDSSYVRILDTDANIDALWTTASTLVNGYMDFTSYEAGLYAQQADGVTGLTITADGTSFSAWTAKDGAEHFTAGVDVSPIDLPAFVPIDGAAPIGAVQLALNQIIRVLANRNIGQQ